MKNIETITNIITEMTDELFEKIQQAEDDYWDLDSKISRNGYKRMVYNLKKVDLTVDEWFAWCSL